MMFRTCSLAVVLMTPLLSQPTLRKHGTATQLVVDGRPFLMLGGELGNSSASSVEYMKGFWPRLTALNLNTVVAPVYWDLMEPQEGKYDFALVDAMLGLARANHQKLVLLWFGSWKNSMSCYAPEWVKTDLKRFPRVVDSNGRSQEIMSPFSAENAKVDARAFAALMRHLKQTDSREHTVVMVQVENEIGIIPEPRDRSAAANEMYAKPVPGELMNYLDKHRDALIPEFRTVWAAAGLKTSGTWEQVFGPGVGTEEIFMAWYLARYTHQVAAAGRAEYNLPMYTNAALIRPNYRPGQYPSAGPLPHLMDVWRAGAPSLDFISPDIYFPNFAEWAAKYHRSGNPLFIPEAQRNESAWAHAFYTFGKHDGMGFSPFGIESMSGPAAEKLAAAYHVLDQIAPIVAEHQGQAKTSGVLLYPDSPAAQVVLGDYQLNATIGVSGGGPANPGAAPAGLAGSDARVGALMVQLAPDEYLVAGSGVVVTFTPVTPGDPVAGIVRIDEGTYNNGRWVPGLRLNGDQDHQGRHLRLPADRMSIQRVKLYRYR